MSADGAPSTIELDPVVEGRRKPMDPEDRNWAESVVAEARRGYIPEKDAWIVGAEEIKRIDNNFLAIDAAIGKILDQLKRRPHRPAKTASAARVNPDRLWFGMVILAINAVFAFGALAASFSGQYAAAAYTPLPFWLFWVVPAAIDLPIMSAAFTAAVFKKRKQRTWQNWLLMVLLTLVAIFLNITHALDNADYFGGTELAFYDWVGVGIMGLMPVLVLVSWENLSRLLIKPTGEQTTPPPAPAKATTARKARA